jgi:hypothetical protein
MDNVVQMPLWMSFMGCIKVNLKYTAILVLLLDGLSNNGSGELWNFLLLYFQRVIINLNS